MSVSRSTQRYRSKEVSTEEKELIARLHELARKYPRYGYRMMTAKLRQEGWRVNRKRVYRLWRQEGLKVPKKTRKKRNLGHSGNSCVRLRAKHKDHVWCWDFIHDRTADGRALKWLTVVDEFTRECLALQVERRIKAADVQDTLIDLFGIRGVPKHIRSDNGPEFIASALRRWLERSAVETLYIEPGAPWENAYAESFNSRLRDELLNVEEFANVAEAKALGTTWRLEYNHRRPHSSLNYATPAAFAAAAQKSPGPQPEKLPPGYPNLPGCPNDFGPKTKTEKTEDTLITIGT